MCGFEDSLLHLPTNVAAQATASGTVAPCPEHRRCEEIIFHKRNNNKNNYKRSVAWALFTLFPCVVPCSYILLIGLYERGYQKWRVHWPSSPAIKTTDTGVCLVCGLEDSTALMVTVVNIAKIIIHIRKQTTWSERGRAMKSFISYVRVVHLPLLCNV